MALQELSLRPLVYSRNILLSCQDVHWWTGVVWIIVMFYQTLILTAPIHCRASDTMLHFFKSEEEANLSKSWMTRWYIFRRCLNGNIWKIIPICEKKLLWKIFLIILNSASSNQPIKAFFATPAEDAGLCNIRENLGRFHSHRGCLQRFPCYSQKWLSESTARLRCTENSPPIRASHKPIRRNPSPDPWPTSTIRRSPGHLHHGRVQAQRQRQQHDEHGVEDDWGTGRPWFYGRTFAPRCTLGIYCTKWEYRSKTRW